MATSVAWTPDGSRIASASNDYSVRLWDGRTGAPLLALRSGDLAAVTSVVFAPDGETIYSLDVRGVITVWRTRAGDTTREPVRTGKGPTQVEWRRQAAGD